MTSDEREILQDILVEYIENPRKMGTCIKNIESLFNDVHERWSISNRTRSSNNKEIHETAQHIIDQVCERYDINYEELVGKRRSSHLITAREQICLAMYKAGFNYSEIGRAIQRHPSTVIHTLNKELEE